MVKSLVTQHFRDKQTSFANDEQTDLIRGKEGVAELFQKPLFQITCGDLGTTARDVEAELEKNFALASRWGCILLLDEADVFLSARERKDFERNGLVADFDEAFASRIHMSLHYPELDEAKTKKIFKLNLNLIQERFDRQGRKIIYDVSSIENFAEQHFRDNIYSRWNGRQIRNACQTALALAEFDTHGGNTEATVDKDLAVALQLKHFTVVQRAYLDFAKYLGDIHGTKGDQHAQQILGKTRGFKTKCQ
ncbi:putative aaa family atpase protein [Phaeoacremonium minimum UCRPA7]|uniref:Putative aaa family atpase protein n=1 Tax=Phaeoacremonium minimum (strain UCR-PA7) TaxID=1286976 RepID=R8BXJ3_PHAM7|nr:putative aaa family atpase protein [Phaeoacremonium minimum UCRPA7]EOO04062.1 putative aaa family atpase protein [Phaeoacremonium minimum UCRPA7]